jgi:hypothetical protein
MSTPLKSGAQLITDERIRVQNAEGFDAAEDDTHNHGELLAGAACYLEHACHHAKVHTVAWPFERSWWKPSTDPIRNLVKAGQFIAAEIDRLQRLNSSPEQTDSRQRAALLKAGWAEQSCDHWIDPVTALKYGLPLAHAIMHEREQKQLAEAWVAVEIRAKGKSNSTTAP